MIDQYRILRTVLIFVSFSFLTMYHSAANEFSFTSRNYVVSGVLVEKKVFNSCFELLILHEVKSGYFNVGMREKCRNIHIDLELDDRIVISSKILSVHRSKNHALVTFNHIIKTIYNFCDVELEAAQIYCQIVNLRDLKARRDEQDIDHILSPWNTRSYFNKNYSEKLIQNLFDIIFYLFHFAIAAWFTFLTEAFIRGIFDLKSNN